MKVFIKKVGRSQEECWGVGSQPPTGAGGLFCQPMASRLIRILALGAVPYEVIESDRWLLLVENYTPYSIILYEGGEYLTAVVASHTPYPTYPTHPTPHTRPPAPQHPPQPTTHKPYTPPDPLPRA